MTKAERLVVYNKFGGRCAYCGCELNGKFQVDEFFPVKRRHKLIKETGCDKFFYSSYKRIPDGCQHPERLHIENQNPSCARCNRWKSDMDIESFRKEIEQQVIRARRDSTNFRMAEDFNLIQVTNKPVIFYYELIT